MKLETPYYLIDERKLLKNLKIIKQVRRLSGAKFVLALKCFSAWSVFGLMQRYMDGTTASSPFEALLGKQKFGKEVHIYSPGYSAKDIEQVRSFCDTIIFNSADQVKRFAQKCNGRRIGLRINPRVSYSHFDIADPGRKYSRLGVVSKKSLHRVLALINGVMFHYNCENADFKNFTVLLSHLEQNFGDVLSRVKWVSLGGGIYFTRKGYPVAAFCRRLRQFSERFNVQVYLEPGETAVTGSAELVVSVLDIVHNKLDIAIVDASTEAHMLDLLIYRQPAKVARAGRGRYQYMIAGRSCLAGDVFGTYRFASALKVGNIIRLRDAAGYTMVKKNWFNGLQMPAIVVKRLNGKTEVVRRFTYKDFRDGLS